MQSKRLNDPWMGMQAGIVCLLVICLLIFCEYQLVRASAAAAPPVVEPELPNNTPIRLSLPIIIVQPPFPAFGDGGFEGSAVSGWHLYSSTGATLIVSDLYLDPVQPHSGQHAAWLGGVANEVSRVSQSVSIADYYTTFTLRYWYWIASNETDCTDDYAFVHIDNIEVNRHEMCRTTQTNGWQFACVAIEAWNSQMPTFHFTTQLDGSKNSNFYLDDVSLGHTCAE